MFRCSSSPLALGVWQGTHLPQGAHSRLPTRPEPPVQACPSNVLCPAPFITVGGEPSRTRGRLAMHAQHPWRLALVALLALLSTLVGARSVGGMPAAGPRPDSAPAPVLGSAAPREE